MLPSGPLGGATSTPRWYGPTGRSCTRAAAGSGCPLDQHVIEVAVGERKPFFTDTTIGGVHARVYTASLPTGDAVQAARPLEEVDRTLRDLTFALVLVGLGGVALAVWLGLVVARAALTPVKQLTDAAEHVARTRDLSRRIRADRTDELSRLGASFNTMLEALASSQDAQRQLVADASHELRTPLTSLRTNIEVLSSDALPAEDRKRLLEDVVVQLGELTVLVTDLVDLARGDEPALVAEDVRLDMLVADAVDRARRHAPDKAFFAELDPTLVKGVPARLDRAVRTCSTTRPSGVRPAARSRSTCATASCRCATTGRASTKPTCPTSSTASTARRPRAACRAPAWASRSCARSRRRTAGRSRPSARTAAVHAWCCACRRRSNPGMRVAIISDTHMDGGRRRLPDRCVELIEESDLLLHAGDIMSIEALAEIEAIGTPLRAITGNMDGWELRDRLPGELELELAGTRVAMLHDAGPAAGRLARMRKRFPEADAVVFGHSHLPLHERDGGFQIFNPGSPTERRKAPRHSMGRATIEGGSIEFEIVTLS